MSEVATSQSDRETAEEIITRLYAHIGRPRPRFLWFEDPIAAIVACNLLAPPALDPDWNEVWRARFAPLRFKHPLGGQIERRLWFQLERELRRELASELETPQARDRSGAGLEHSWSAFWPQLEAQVGSALARQLRRVLHVRGGIHAARPLGELLAVHIEGFWGGTLEGGPRRPPRLGTAAARLEQLQRACGWWSPRAEAVICSDGPRRVLVDGAGRLHAERGPAIEFSDAHKVFAWHGTRVPAPWIERRDALPASVALAWPNPEQRLAALEIVGWAKILERLPTRVVHVDRDPQIGTLLECPLPGAGLARFLRVRCGTGREFVLGVPITVRTAREANAWTYGLQGDQYQPEARS